MRRLSMLALLALLSATAGACSRGEGKVKLPPATGEGAPPLPTLPTPGAGEPAAAPVGATTGKTTGTLFPHAEAQLAPNASGTIAEILVEEGARVKKGDVLFRLDARDAALRRDQARAALDAARVGARAAKVELDRSRVMLDANALNRAQWDQIEARHDAAVAAEKQAQVALAMAQKAVADATIRSPLDGVVTARLKSVGEMVTMMPPTVVLVVQRQDPLELRFRLPEASLARVKAGDSVSARFAAVELTRAAKVIRVNPTGDARTRTVEIVAELENADGALRPGLLAEIDLGGAP
jgi:RND family efflux transporter MFP subunit